MFGKLFGSKKVPQNEGTSSSIGRGGFRIVQAFELELSNMEGAPAYSLTHQLTIGSEIGNIIVASESVSPRHATFILEQDVVSVIDHGSVSGTLVNGKKIPSGRYIILDEADVLMVGELQVKIRSIKQSVPIEKAPLMEMKEEDKTPTPAPLPKSSSAPRRVERKKLKKKAALASTYSANSLVRVIAVGLDLLLAYGVVVVAWPFDEFRHFMDFIFYEMGEILGVNWEALWMSITEDHGFLRELVADAYSYFSGFFPALPLAFTFILLRFLVTLLLGVSLSEFLLSIRPAGNQIWARIGGGIRVLIGIITGPLIIFDVPAVVSRRTFKEFMTFTNIQLRSKFVALMATFMCVPLFISLALIAPLFEGLEPPVSIPVNDKLDQRIKLQTSEQNGEATSEEVHVSKFLNLELAYNPTEVSLIPAVKFQGNQTKLNYNSQMIFYHKELQRPVTLAIMKHFDFQQLLGIGIKGNFFLYDKFPEIHSFVYRVQGVTPFKASDNARTQLNFANEFIRFTKLVMELDLANSLEVMEMETPFLKGLIEYRSSFLSLIEYKDFDQIGFIKLGNVIFMKITYSRQRPFDLIIPLVKGEGRIIRVEYDKKENLSALSSKFYKFILHGTDWMNPQAAENGETLNAFQVLDLLTSLNNDQKKLSPDKAQALYGYYFEKSAAILKGQDGIEYEIWKNSLLGIVMVIETLKASNTVEDDPENPVHKLQQNFKDLRDAVENKNLEYFGVSNPTV